MIDLRAWLPRVLCRWLRRLAWLTAFQCAILRVRQLTGLSTERAAEVVVAAWRAGLRRGLPYAVAQRHLQWGLSLGDTPRQAIELIGGDA